MKKFFSSGLALLLPIVLTLLIALFFINFITQPFLAPIQQVVSDELLQNFHSPYFDREALVMFISRTFALMLILGVILLVGALGRLFLLDWFFRVGNWLIHQVPLVNKIYKPCQDLVHSLFSPESKSFSQVVLAPFPFKGQMSIGFITKESIAIQGFQALVPVFVPGTPNPSVGFLLLFDPKELVPIEISIEEAMKFVVSCGIVLPANMASKDIF